MSHLEFIAALGGLITTWLYIKQNNWSWPLGLVVVFIYAVIFYRVHLYADMSLQFIYVLMQLYGWWQWVHGTKEDEALAISHLNLQAAILLACLALLGVCSIYYILHTYTHSQLVLWDSLAMVLSLIAQGLLARKVIQCWYLWFVVDAMYVAIYFSKSLYWTALLSLVFLALAMTGYWQWRKSDSQTIVSS